MLLVVVSTKQQHTQLSSELKSGLIREIWSWNGVSMMQGVRLSDLDTHVYTEASGSIELWCLVWDILAAVQMVLRSSLGSYQLSRRKYIHTRYKDSISNINTRSKWILTTLL